MERIRLAPLDAAISAGAVVFAGILGYATVESPQAALVFVAIAVLLLLATTPPIAWCLAAVVAAVTFRAFSSAGILPGIGTYLDIPLAWGALVVSLVHTRTISPIARRVLLALGGLGLAVALSWAFSGSEPLRPLFDYALIGEPFALVAALVVAPPAPTMRSAAIKVLVALIAIQVPICFIQLALKGIGDGVQGTYIGSKAGAHLVGAVTSLGAFWLLAAKLSLRRLLAAAVLVVVPFISGAKQVVFAFPASLLMFRTEVRAAGRLRAILILVPVIVLVITPSLNDQYGVVNIQHTVAGNSVKVQSTQVLLSRLAERPASLAFGMGPAETVSRAAFLTLDPLLKSSPVALLHLHPSQFALEITPLTPLGSFDSPLTSAVGVVGDLGLFGTLAWLALFGVLLRATFRVMTPLGRAATAGLMLYALLGFVADWWEESGFTLPLALLVGLALTEAKRESAPAD